MCANVVKSYEGCTNVFKSYEGVQTLLYCTRGVYKRYYIVRGVYKRYYIVRGVYKRYYIVRGGVQTSHVLSAGGRRQRSVEGVREVENLARTLYLTTGCTNITRNKHLAAPPCGTVSGLLIGREQNTTLPLAIM